MWLILDALTCDPLRMYLSHYLPSFPPRFCPFLWLCLHTCSLKSYIVRSFKNHKFIRFYFFKFILLFLLFHWFHQRCQRLAGRSSGRRWPAGKRQRWNTRCSYCIRKERSGVLEFMCLLLLHLCAHILYTLLCVQAHVCVCMRWHMCMHTFFF